MATNFPNSLDDSTTIPVESANTKLSTNHVTAHQNIQDAIEAIEAKVGADSSAVTTSHDYKLSEVTSTDKAVGKTATQTLTNKTLTSPVVNVGSDATGDIYYRNAGVLARLPVGTNGQYLSVSGGVPAYSSFTGVTTEDVNNAAPIGHVVDWLTNSAPTNWLLCDGSAVSRTTYATLFAVLGTTYGTGDGSTTFNLPNIKGRVTVGRDSGQTEFDTLGETGGAKTHTLTAAEIPSHTHGVFGGGVPVGTNNAGATSGNLLSKTSLGILSDLLITDNGTGGNSPHNNLQPYIVLNKIVRAL